MHFGALTFSLRFISASFDDFIAFKFTLVFIISFVLNTKKIMGNWCAKTKTNKKSAHAAFFVYFPIILIKLSDVIVHSFSLQLPFSQCSLYRVMCSSTAFSFMIYHHLMHFELVGFAALLLLRHKIEHIHFNWQRVCIVLHK